MPQNRKIAVQKPPPGIVWIEDYRDEDDDTVFIPGIASRLGISVSTYKKWRMRDEGPVSFLIGKKVAARIEDIDAYLAGLHRAAVDAAQQAAAQAAHDMRPPEGRYRRRATRKHVAPGAAKSAA